MPAYTYLLTDLLTDQPLTTLPLSGVSFERRISRTGTLTAQLGMSNRATLDLGHAVDAAAGHSALWVYRDAVPWWAGPLWKCHPVQDARGATALSLSAATFDSYAHRRWLPADRTHLQVDQGIIIPDMWRAIQLDPRGNIGVIAEDQPTGVLRDRTYLAADLPYVGKLIEDLGDVIDGPEHTIDTYLDANGNRVKRLRLAQRLGLVDDARHVFSRAQGSGGNIVSWWHDADALLGGTRFRARGDAAGTDAGAMLSDPLYADNLLTAGWPLLDVAEDHPGTIDLGVLNGWAQTLRDAYSGAVRTSGYTVRVGSSGWSPNRLGDLVRIKMADAWHPNFDAVVRPVGAKVNPSDTHDSETVELLFGGF